MAAADDINAPPRRRDARFRIAVAIATLLGVALFGVWLARVPIATGFIDRKLSASGVPARYHIADLGFGRQRLTNVVIGDPAAPDLVADWIETRTDLTTAGPALAGVRAGHVRVRGRLTDGRVSLGALDRLLPAPSGKPFALPRLDVAIADGRMRLETPVGLLGVRLSGGGRLDDGFRGDLAAVATSLAPGGCRIAAPRAALDVRTRDGAIVLAGPVAARALACAGFATDSPQAKLALTLAPGLARWSGSADVAVATLRSASARVAAGSGRIGFRGDATRTDGTADLAARDISAAGAQAERASFTGSWRLAGTRVLAAGQVAGRAVSLDPALRRRVLASGAGASGTPVGPLIAAATGAAARALGRFDATGELGIGSAAGGLFATLRQIEARSASGATARFEGTVALGDPAGLALAGRASIGGGGLPQASVALAQERPGGAIEGTATIAPYAAGDARLALTPVRFSQDGQATRISTTATLSGPLGDGRVDGLRVPLVARWAGSRLVLNPACAPAAFERLRVAGLMLAPTRLRLCPVDGALFRLDGSRIGGGARIAAPRLSGRLGGSPITLAARDAVVRIGTRGFTISGLAARLGSADRVTRLDIAQLAGTIDARGVAGNFAGGAGQIGKVPLLLSDAAGDWTLRGGTLDLAGALTVADDAPDPRFRPLAARGVRLRLKDDAIAAEGTLFEPAKSIKVADVTIRHALASGIGSAHLAVPGITFGDGFQPEELTRLTFGVIADVKGMVGGAGDIAWSPAGVTSTGTFRTANTDLAAAFGPVTGISGEIRFTDLLNLESAPDQVVTVASINPGVPVTDGRVVYRTLPGNRVQIASGRWPFAGGTLTLDPTLLDFSAAQQRRLTFRVAGMEAAQFLQQFDFDNINATGVFDGVLPMVFDESGGRIAAGRLTVRPGGGTLAYVGELTEKNLGTWGNMAFQALKSLRYRNLDIVMNGALAGEMITEVRFAGVSQGAGAKSNFLIRRLQKLPFVFNIRIRAPFRGLLDSVASFYDPKRLIARNLPALLEEQNKRADPPIQPPASEPMR